MDGQPADFENALNRAADILRTVRAPLPMPSDW
jgi:hypothetical protein